MTKIRTWLVVLLVMALGAAACGDDSSDESTDEGEPTEETIDDEVEEPTEDETEEDVEDEPVELTATDVGVTESVIHLGAVFPDTTQIAQDPGDLKAKFQTIADAINEAGGINGRMIELHWRSPNPLLDNDWDRVCTELTEDVGVFAAIGLFVRTNADCYAGLHDTIVVSTFGIADESRASYTAPGLSLVARASRLVEPRVQALIDGGALAAGDKVAVLGSDLAQASQTAYVEALEAAGVEVVVETVLTADGNDQLAVEGEMQVFVEAWRSNGAEAVLASTALLSQALLMGYNRTGADLPMLLPEGLGVPPATLQEQRGLDLAPFQYAVSLGDESQATKYETGVEGVTDCVDAFQEASGEVVALDESRDNLPATVVACQAFDIFTAIATAAGPELTTESFAAAADAYGEIEITDVSEASVGADKYDLSDSVGVITRFNPETVQFEPVE